MTSCEQSPAKRQDAVFPPRRKRLPNFRIPLARCALTLAAFDGNRYTAPPVLRALSQLAALLRAIRESVLRKRARPGEGP